MGLLLLGFLVPKSIAQIDAVQNQYPQIQLGYTTLTTLFLTLESLLPCYQTMGALNLADEKPANPLHGISLLRVINNMLFVKHHLWEYMGLSAKAIKFS